MGRPGVVTSSVSVARRPVSAEPRRSAQGERQERSRDRTAHGIGDGTDPRPIVGRERADPAQDGGQAALLAQDVELERLERRDVGARGDGGQASHREGSRGRGSDRRGPRPSFHRWAGNRSPRASATSRAGAEGCVAVGAMPGRFRPGSIRVGLGELDDLPEGRGVADGEVGQDLAIDLDVGLLEAGDELAVGQAVLARRGVDPDDPQLGGTGACAACGRGSRRRGRGGAPRARA